VSHNELVSGGFSSVTKFLSKDLLVLSRSLWFSQSVHTLKLDCEHFLSHYVQFIFRNCFIIHHCKMVILVEMRSAVLSELQLTVV